VNKFAGIKFMNNYSIVLILKNRLTSNLH